MIPRIGNLQKSSSLYQNYCAELKNSAFSGDIEDQYASRLLCATDNSVYQCMPSLVIFPKTEEDLVIAFKLGNKDQYKTLTFVPRGGGTGTNGQS